MKRKLTKQERELTKKGLENRQKEIEDLEEAIIVNKKHQEFLEFQRDYEDVLRPYNRKVEDSNLDIKIRTFEEKLKLAKIDVKNLNSQLKDGVNVKKASGVN